MKILIADDEPLARERLARMLTEIPYCTVLQPSAENGYDALQLVARLKPDILLLDIGMPGLDGLQVAAQLCEQSDAPAVIFCTAHDEHALQAFDVSAIGYLVKPVRTEQLLAALEKAQHLSPLQLATLSRAPRSLNVPRTHLSARTHKGIELIPLEQVIHCVADNKYVTLRHTDGETLLDESLKSLEEEFAERFVRIHRNALVSRNHIERLQRTPSGHYELHLRGVPEGLSVSRRHVAAVRKLMDQL
ncbi:LytR/AlgR family response regulator transcription factor [Denitrificimonas caeni]|uniref:LytR/AlgR family response regulator transcription factor n=1 Tax=Denitrificimonas caeni TaxID=521720 RepID=UPI001962FAB4|nr:LytTR family DNA-binding domain-containing protein [Denitrificimonas caeni]